MTFDVAVIGGGIVARAIVSALRRENISIAAVFAPSAVDRSATAAAGAMLSTVSEVYQSEHPAIREIAICSRLESCGMFDDWLDSVEIARTAVLRTSGTFVVGNNCGRSDEDAFELMRSAAQRHRVPVESVSHREVPALQPERVAQPIDAVFLPSEGSVDSAALLSGLDRIFRSHPVAWFAENAVSITEREDVFGIQTLTECIFANQVIVAAGAWSADLLKDVGGAPQTPELFGGRGVSVLLKELRFSLPHVIRTPNRAFACGIHVVPRVDRTVYLGATNRFSFETGSSTPSVGELHALLSDGMRQININLRGGAVHSSSVGYRPLTPDHLPLVGRMDNPRILLATGTYRNGVVLAPLIGRLIEEEITAPGTHLSHPFSPRRPALARPQLSSPLWHESAARALMDALIEAQAGSQLRFEQALFPVVHAALGMLSNEEGDQGMLSASVRRLLRRAPLEEAIPSLLDIFLRAGAKSGSPPSTTSPGVMAAGHD